MNKSKSFSEKMSIFIKKAGEVSKKVASNLNEISTGLLNRSSSFNESMNFRNSSYNNETSLQKSSTRNGNNETIKNLVSENLIMEFEQLNV